VDREGPNVARKEHKMEAKIICYKRRDERKKSETWTREVMVRREVMEGMRKRGS